MSERKGKIIQLVLFALLLLGGLGARAQEKLMPVMPQEEDSTQLAAERQMLYYQLTSGKLENSELYDIPQLPKMDFGAVINQRFSITPSGVAHSTDFGFMPYMFSVSPFYRNASVFSAASYQLSNKFTVGGYSFGANSIFSAPLPNQGMNNFDTHGSTLFMQYKVSKNFKIETRVTVTQGPGVY